MRDLLRAELVDERNYRKRGEDRVEGPVRQDDPEADVDAVDERVVDALVGGLSPDVALGRHRRAAAMLFTVRVVHSSLHRGYNSTAALTSAPGTTNTSPEAGRPERSQRDAIRRDARVFMMPL